MSVEVTTTAGNSVTATVTGGASVSFSTSSTSVSVTSPTTSTISVSEKGPKGATGVTGATGGTGATGADGSDGKTYSVSCADGDNGDEEKIRLTDSDGTTDDVVLEAGTGLSIARSSDKITFTNTVSDTNTTYSAGDGLDLSTTTFSTDLKSNGGLVIESTEIAVDLAASSITGTLATGDGGTGSTSTAYCALGSNVSGALPVANGGTGATSLTADGVLFGNGGSAISAVDLSTSGNVIIGGANPAAVTGANLAGSGLAATVGDGTLVLAVETLNQDTTGTAAGLSATLAVGSGGTGTTTLADNSVLTGTGGSAITAEANLTFSSEALHIGANDTGLANFKRAQRTTSGAGGILNIGGGNPKAAETNTAGGDLGLFGGISTGSAAGGDVTINTYSAGGSGTSWNTTNVKTWTFEDTGNLTLPSSLTLDSVAISAVQTSSESFVDNDTSLMTSAAIDDRINAKSEGGWHGSSTRIKILFSDFIGDDGGRPSGIIDDTGAGSEEFFVESYGTNPMYVTKAIPTGYKATVVMIYGSATDAVEVWEHEIDSKTGVSKGTGNVDTEIDITDVTSSTTNYLLIQVANGTGNEVHGGYITIAAV